MLGYVIIEIDVKDPEGYEEYRKLAAPTVAAFGGRTIVRGGKADTLEGDWQPKRIVVLEFESVERAKQWWDSPEYNIAKEMRHRTAVTRMIAIEGVPNQPT